MNMPGSKQALPPDSNAGPSVTLVTILQCVDTPNLIRALAAILFWSLVIGVVSLCSNCGVLRRIGE